MASSRIHAGADLEAANREIDALIGGNLRLRRKALGLSQGQVAEELGVTFQQVQKYERGANRVSGSTLWRYAGVLGCDVRELFTGAPAPSQDHRSGLAPDAAMVRLLAQGGGLEMAEAFARVPPRHRRPLITIAKALGRAD